MNLLPMMLPEMKNLHLKKKIDKTIIMSGQCSNLLSQVEGSCTNSVDKFKKEYKDKEKKLNRQFEEFLTEVQDKKWLTESGEGIISHKPKVDRFEAEVTKMLEF
jgi:ClpP class serine protease